MKNYPIIDLKATGKRIESLRRSKKITISYMCDFFGVLPQSIYKWQRGDALPSIDNMCALSILFDVPIDDVIVLQDDDTACI